MEEPPVLDRAAVARLLRVAPATVAHYQRESKAGGRYAKHPFPEPDGRVSRAPYWLASRAEEILKWDEDRVALGAGGRPRQG